MRVILVIGTGFWLFVGLAISPIAYALAGACLLLICADGMMRIQGARAKQLDKRLNRWCNPIPLPETRRKKPQLMSQRVVAGRSDTAPKPKATAPTRPAPGRSSGLRSDFETKPDIRVSTRTSRSRA